jgi:hypothetical protein
MRIFFFELFVCRRECKTNCLAIAKDQRNLPDPFYPGFKTNCMIHTGHKKIRYYTFTGEGYTFI